MHLTITITVPDDTITAERLNDDLLRRSLRDAVLKSMILEKSQTITIDSVAYSRRDSVEAYERRERLLVQAARSALDNGYDLAAMALLAA
jgi:hypothetical protein